MKGGKRKPRNSSSAAPRVSPSSPPPTTLPNSSPPHLAFSTNSPAGQAVQNIIDALPGLIGVAIVDLTSGMSLASHSTNPSFNPDTAAAYNTEVVKQKQKAMQALKLTNETIEDILISLTNQLHLIKLVGGGSKFIYLAVNSRETNLAIAREVLRSQGELLK